MMTYELKPFPWIKTRWVTRITKLKHLDFFEDEQVRRTYRSWKHTHTFISTPQGIKIEDKIIYELPIPYLDGLINRYIIVPKLQTVFAYRQQTINLRFNDPTSKF